MEHLFSRLREYAEAGIYPYHMPGHKRRPWGELPEELYRSDITEIDGFDNLHQPEGILLELQQRAARLYGAEESFYLVNGSTGGILCAVSSALPSGGHILMARNCHRAVYHGAYLRNLKVTYLWPPYLKEYSICDAVTPEQVREALEKEPDIEAVIIVSPTYEGRIADVRAIAEIVHKKGIPLIVDEAHGAHLGLAEGFAPNSCQMGADVVIHSVHKTLPAPTQTALLHVNGGRIDRRVLKRFLAVYQSSSPSYILMAGIDNALQYVEAEGKTVFCRFRKQYEKMTESLAGCRYLHFPEGNQDIGKLLISVKGTGLTGKQLYDILLKKYRLQLEMAARTFALAMFTVNDGEEAYERMTKALLEIDGCLQHGQESCFRQETYRNCLGERFPGNSFCQERPRYDWYTVLAEKTKEEEALSLSAAWDMPWEWVPLRESTDRFMGEFINLYPPGTPLVVPGERMTEELCRYIESVLEQGLTVQGVEKDRNANSGEAEVRVRAIKGLR